MEKNITIEAKYDVQKDARIYIRKFASFVRNVDTIVEKFLPPDIFIALKSDVSQQKKIEIMENYLQLFFKNNKNKFEDALQSINTILQDKIVLKKIIEDLEGIYQIKLNCEKITIYMTTFPRCPYNFKEKWFAVNVFGDKNYQISVIKHELNHFFFHQKFGDKEQEIGSENFYKIKESFTIITLPEEKGYPGHHDLRINIKKRFNEGKTTEAIFNLAYEQIKNGG